MPRLNYRTTFVNVNKVYSPTAMLTAGMDYAHLSSQAREHAAHAKHARQRGDHIAAAYHESRHQYLSTVRGKAATILAARTGIGVGTRSGEHFGLNITKGWSPGAHTNTYNLLGGKKKPAAGGGGGLRGRQHRKSNGQFG